MFIWLDILSLQQDKEELNDIDNKLREDGFKTSISVEHKLRYIWRQFTRADASLKSSLESLEELRKQHAQEMIEVENYVSHIRQLSDEREALTDRKSTRLNSSHANISYAVFCLKKKKKRQINKFVQYQSLITM